MPAESEALREAFERIEPLLRAGVEFEGRIEEAQGQIREQSKRVVGQVLLDGRLMLMAASVHAMAARSGVPGRANKTIAHQLLLLASFFQGIGATERLIMEGQYVKAAAVLKQDLEILARVGEVVAGAATPGKQPNVKYAPGTGKMYGQLNSVAHPSDVELLEVLLDQDAVPGGVGVSPIPILSGETVLGLYELHIYLLVALSQHLVRVMRELHGDHDELNQAAELWHAATTILAAEGHIQESAAAS